MNRFFLALVNFYQLHLSHIFGGNCRFYPSCSDYAKECFQKNSFGSALLLTIRRLAKCHPLGQQGYDPVPQANASICCRKADHSS